jgi:hypothetical protein
LIKEIKMSDRNEFLEMDGLFWKSDTHEWFNDKTATNYAQTDNGLNKDSLKNIHCFVTRNMETGEYDRVVMDSNTNEIIYTSKSLEDVSFFIDKLKIMKRFEN